VNLRPDEVVHRLFAERLVLIQSRHGFRTSVDALALAAWAVQAEREAGRVPDHVADLGAGSGLVAVLAGLALPKTELWLVEAMPVLADRARRNLLANGLAARATVVACDLAGPTPPVPPCSLVLCNPPYFPAGASRPPSHPERHAAHTESTASLDRFAEVAAALAAPDGSAVFVFPADQRARLLRAMAAAGLVDCEVQPLLHREGDTRATRVIVRGRRGEPVLRERPALWQHPAAEPDSVWSPWLAEFLADLPPQRDPL
jgi:tRNA1(Val) A37 N6-methylase TrmN6